MKKIKHLNILLILLIVFNLSCSRNSDKNPYNGIWKMESKGSGGITISTYFDLKQIEMNWKGL
jgi:hypothetical protein